MFPELDNKLCGERSGKPNAIYFLRYAIPNGHERVGSCSHTQASVGTDLIRKSGP